MGKRICLLIPDGVGIRNYLYSDIIKYLVEQGNEIVVWHALADEVIKEAENLHGINIQAIKFIAFPDSFLVRLLRESTTFARLRFNALMRDNPTILTNWNTKRNNWAKKLLYPIAEFLGKRLHSKNSISKTEKIIKSLQLKSKAFNIYSNELKKLDLDVLLCTHQRVSHVVTAILAAEYCGVKTYTSIYSWDNLPKGRLPMRVSKYFVWSDFMKNELVEYYWDINPQDIIVSGTPQFDFYKSNQFLSSREKFASAHGLNTNKKWILFSGDDPTTSPYDPLYLEDIAKALGGRDDIQILFRQVPSETTIRYDNVLKKYNYIYHIQPKWERGAKWSKFYPKFDDVKMLMNLSKHCQLVVNIGSTMAMDFSNYDKPTLFINYDQENSRAWSVNTIYKFQHFRTMKGLNPVGWINDREEIAEKIDFALRHPDSTGPDRKEWFAFIVYQQKSTSASSIIAHELSR